VKVLIADDDPVSLRMMERTLQNCGYDVITAKNGLQAAHILSNTGGPRLAILDWMMPGLDGLGVCREIRSRNDDAYTYILLLTSKQSNEDIVSGLEAGADDYLTKPCYPAELRARLHTGRRVLQLEDKLVDTLEKMRFKATHDSLTSLWNRGGILALFRSELSESSSKQTSVSLLLCDIDHFKQINDRYGHAIGDEVLQQVSTRLQNLVRPLDYVGRYGGEEFLAVLGSCNQIDIRRRAEQVRQGISCVPFTTQAGVISVSLSIGAITIENWDKVVAIELYLNEADAALYRAKAAGRDRVIYAPTDVGLPCTLSTSITLSPSTA
jgi:two-component system cell cycle response regulator